MQELNMVEIDEVSGGIIFIPLIGAFTPAIGAGIAAGSVAFGSAVAGTFIGMRYIFNEM